MKVSAVFSCVTNSAIACVVNIMNKRKYYCIEITKPKTAFAKSLSNRDWDGFF